MTAVRTWLRTVRRTYWGRLALCLVVTGLLAIASWLGSGLRVDHTEVTNLVTEVITLGVIGLVLAAKTVDDYHLAYLLCAGTCAALSFVVFRVREFPWWVSWGVSGLMMLVSGVMWVGKSISERRARVAPRGVWVVLPDGREIPVEVRPRYCGACQRPHWRAYAISEKILLPEDGGVRLRAEKHARRTVVELAVVTDETNRYWLTTADDPAIDGDDTSLIPG